MPEPMKPKLTEVIHDMLWACGTLIVVAIQSIPLALAMFVALTLWFLPEAIGWHQSWAHIIFELNQAGVPHRLFFIVKQLFVVAWVFALSVKILTLQDAQNLVVQQRLIRERRNMNAGVISGAGGGE